MKNLKILIVDDDRPSQLLLKILIEKYSKETLTARNGIEALETVLSNPDINLIYMDIRLPLMDGHETIHRIRKFNKEVVIFAQSASEYNNKGKEPEYNEFIPKPYKNDKIRELIELYFS